MGHTLTRIALTAGLAAIFALPAPAATSTWQIDPQHSAAQFSVRHLAISTVRGGFSNVNGTVNFDDKDFSKSSVDVTIDVSTVDTREPNRDKDLKSDKFFDLANYPTMTFKSKKVEQAGRGKLKITGDLTIRGVTKEVVLDVDGPTAAVKDPWGNQRAAVSATTKINRQDFGVKWNATMDNGGVVVGDEVSITIDAEMVQKTASKSGN
jgi:polyisoprenoid-binding protein YceI